MATRDKDKKDVVIGCATYEGETKNGMKHGMGTLTWDDGDQVCQSNNSQQQSSPPLSSSNYTVVAASIDPRVLLRVFPCLLACSVY
jgi:hypothetical protein